jgi:hypothetical protein
MSKKKTPPEYGESSGPMIVACQWNMSSPTGPAEQFDGGSLPRSTSSCSESIVEEETCESTGVKTSKGYLWGLWSGEVESFMTRLQY